VHRFLLVFFNLINCQTWLTNGSQFLLWASNYMACWSLWNQSNNK